MAGERWQVLVGLDYVSGGTPRRAEPDDVVDDLPAESVGWLSKQGLIAQAPAPTEREARR